MLNSAYQCIDDDIREKLKSAKYFMNEGLPFLAVIINENMHAELHLNF